MDFSIDDDLSTIRSAVRDLCSRFPGEYWRGLEPDRYPTEFVDALTKNGWLAALIPEECGGSGLSLAPDGLREAFAVTEPNVGSDTTRIQTRAKKVDGGQHVLGMPRSF
jgi:alkylation response protein AidB-like acyl-CoA dehydrogenase